MTDFFTPRRIEAGDVLSDFSCGEESLDRWIRGYARGNEKRGASRTKVAVTRDGLLAGYYCLSASSLRRSEVPEELSRNMPEPVPVVLIGRLAVDERYSGQGLGYSLLQHAVITALEAAEAIGIRAILVHALSEPAVSFYKKFGFTRFPGSSMTLYLLCSDAKKTLTEG